MQTAKIFQNGQSQAVRLPKEFRFNSKSVYIKKMGRSVILIPTEEPWQNLIESLDNFSEDFMATREQPTLQKREDI